MVLDPTANVKLSELQQAFVRFGGESYIGQAAWDHLALVAGPTMARFLDIYVHTPLQELLQDASQELPDLILRMSHDRIILEIGEEYISIPRGKEEQIIACLLYTSHNYSYSCDSYARAHPYSHKNSRLQSHNAHAHLAPLAIRPGGHHPKAQHMPGAQWCNHHA